jgi:signal transduction histidine kinase
VDKELGLWLATVPATPQQRRRTFALIAALFVASCATAPFAKIRLWESPGFIPTVQAIIFVTALITAALLLTQFSLARSRALLVLANAYLFTAVIVSVHTLTFPGAFAPGGLLGAGLQTTGWLYVIWHFAFPAAVIVYALVDRTPVRASTRSVVGGSVATVIALAVGILWFLTAADDIVPAVFVDRRTYSPTALYLGAVDTLVGAAALGLLLRRGGSVLDQWLAISLAATTVELAMSSFFSAARFDVGWFAIRIFSVVSSTVVLLALLTETTRLYAKHSIALRALHRERANKLLSAQAATAAIAHEIRQPLTAISLNGSAGLVYLQRDPADLGEVRESFETIVEDCRRMSGVIEGVCSLFRIGDLAGQPIDMNEIIAEVIGMQQYQLARAKAETHRELMAGLPLVRGHRAQLQEVVANLVNNAIEAMEATSDRDRVLRLKTQLRGRDAIAVEIQDTGPGIDPKRLGEIFDAFVTTKPQGTGLGLAICRMIIDHHGGELTASSDGKSGAQFEVVLPVMRT